MTSQTKTKISDKCNAEHEFSFTRRLIFVIVTNLQNVLR